MKKIFCLFIAVLLAVLSGCNHLHNYEEINNDEEITAARKPFSVTSGETTIYPSGHWTHGQYYDEQSGYWNSVSGWVDLNEWIDSLETIYYEPNFEITVDGNNYFNILVEGTRSEYNDIAELPFGEYIIEYIVTYQGQYVSAGNDYNLSMYVYWFKLINDIYIPVTEITVRDDYGTGGFIPLAAIGDTHELTITVLPENATYKELEFSSSNPDYVGVDENGLLTALDFGCSMVTVTAKDGVSVSIHVYSGKSIVSLVEFNERTVTHELTLKKGDVFDLNSIILVNPESERDNIIWFSYDIIELYDYGGKSYTYESTMATVENGILTCLESGFVLVHVKHICEHIPIENSGYMEWVITIEE